jgi:hypothetical protein
MEDCFPLAMERAGYLTDRVRRVDRRNGIAAKKIYKICRGLGFSFAIPGVRYVITTAPCLGLFLRSDRAKFHVEYFATMAQMVDCEMPGWTLHAFALLPGHRLEVLR